MLYCDLTLNGALAWSGVPCMLGVPINSRPYLGFSGDLVFIDTEGVSDPTYDGLGTRYFLLYVPADGSGNVVIPLQADPAQQLSIILGSQNCILSIDDKDNYSSGAGFTSAVVISAPLLGVVGTVYTASATGPLGSTWVWSISNGTLLSGQGTSTITYQGTSTGSTVNLQATASPLSGGSFIGVANTIMAATPSAVITAPEYVWAGQFDVAASVPAGAGLTYTWTESGMRPSGSSAGSTFLADAGQVGSACSVSVLVSGVTSVSGSWTFKVVPYTSSISHTSPLLSPGSYEDFTLPLGWQYTIQSMASDFPALLRVYETASARVSDAGRAVGTDPNVDPTNPAPIVFEGTADTLYPYFILEHSAIGTNGDTPVRTKNAYCRVFNMDSTSRTPTITLVRTELQTSPTF